MLENVRISVKKVNIDNSIQYNERWIIITLAKKLHAINCCLYY
jgi:hypothetical protein